METEKQSPSKTSIVKNTVHKQNWGNMVPTVEVNTRNPVFFQTKLTVGSANDPMEHEADSVAEKVMRMPGNSFVQRKCASCEEEESKAQLKPLVSTIQPKGDQASFLAPDTVSTKIKNSRGGGVGMDGQTKNFMASKFGADFNSVKIHTDGEAVQMSKELGAKAFTVGNDIYFNQGEYSPRTGEGGRLLAHELTHTLQQNEIIKRQVAPPDTSPSLVLSAAEAAERVQLRLFDSGGFFATQNQVLNQFRSDMMAVGWFAGDRRTTSSGVTISSVAQAAIQGAASEAATKGMEIVLTSLGGFAAASGGLIAGGLVGILAAEIVRINSYNPVITELALKPPHQIFIESMQDIINSTQEHVRDQWTLQRDETIAQFGAAGLSQYADRIRTATTVIRNNYYTHLVFRFLPFAERKSTELETPHALYTGEGRGFTPFVGSSTHVSTISTGQIYVELSADSSYNLTVVRTVIPELRSGVLNQLNSQSMIFSTLPIRRLIIEANSPIGPARIVWNSSSASFDVPDSPHFSREFCRQVYRAKTGDTGLDHIGGVSGGLTEQQFAGAVNVYAWLLGLPLNRMNFFV